jgi:hypothetical protein
MSEGCHVTAFLTDFALAPGDEARVRRDLDGVETRPVFCDLRQGLAPVLTALAAAGVDLARDYLSLQVLTSTERGLGAAKALVARLRRGDFARLELPWHEMGFQPEQASLLLGVVMAADYGEQERIAGRFFDLLSRRTPYEVCIRTRGATLTLQDVAPWFDLGGRLQPGDERILPGGEVAYVGAAIAGTFTVDGAILATPQLPRAAPLARRLLPLSAHLAEAPVTLCIDRGRVERVSGGGAGGELLSTLLEEDAYRTVTEVGISFNRACVRYIHDWPAACNEGRPGAHIALGGDPDPEAAQGTTQALVHVDLMAATSDVSVNDQVFLRTSS